MSKSKKAPYYTDNGGNRTKIKRLANKRVRQAKIITGDMVKKVFNSWDICDFKFVAPKDPKAYRK